MRAVQDRLLRAIPDLVVLFASLLGQIAGVAWLLGWAKGIRRMRVAIVVIGLLSMAGSMWVFMLRFRRVSRLFPAWSLGWGQGLALCWAMLSLCWLAGCCIVWLCARIFERRAGRRERRVGGHDPARRIVLKTAYGAVFAAPPAALAYGAFIERHQLFLREQRIEIPGLPADLDGLRLVQLTDIHLSPFFSRAELLRAVSMANESRPQIALVTGDLISTWRDPLDDCLDILAGLRADAGTYGCLGNHEIYAGAEAHTQREGARRGIRFLRREAVSLRFGKATLNVAGVDYQPLHRPYLAGMEKLVVPGALNVMLSHNPAVFPVAASQGYGLTIAGHTHGGQIRFELLNADVNPGRFYTPYVDGFYQRGPNSIFVSRGLGTIALPARLGAPPEVALLRLCRI